MRGAQRRAMRAMDTGTIHGETPEVRNRGIGTAAWSALAAAWARSLTALRCRPSWIDALAGAAVVLALGFAHPTSVNAPTLRAVLETIMSLFALAAAAMLCQQIRQAPRVRNVLLLTAVIVLALTEFVANALPAGLHLRSGSGLSAALPVGQLMAAGILVWAARTPSQRHVLRRDRLLVKTVVIACGLFGLAELLGWLIHAALAGKPVSGSGLSRSLHNPVALVMMIATVALLLWAAAQFTRRGRIEQNRVLALLGEAALLLAAARLYYLALPTLSPETASPREALRVVAFTFIFFAVLRTDLDMRTGIARAAAAAERRRVAQDLHDGLAQDLAFIAAHGPSMVETLGPDHPVTRAARHALAVSRDAISHLSDPTSSSVREVLEGVAQEAGDRFAMAITVEAPADLVLTRDAQDQVSRIAREALANAGRHGGASHVLVALRRTPAGIVLRVVDDGNGIGNGFESGDEGFGIRSMRERATALGGRLALRSGQAGGTELKVILPQ